MSNFIEKTKNLSSDIIDKVSTPTSRAGHSLERIYKMNDAGVCHAAITAQMNDNSANNNTYTEEHIKGMINLYEDCKTKVPVSRAAAEALIEDAIENQNNSIPDTSTADNDLGDFLSRGY